MGFFDDEVNNSLEHLFDFNRDGHLDICERAMMFDALERENAEIEGREPWSDEDDDDDYL